MTYPATPTVWLTATDKVAVGLRRYTPTRRGADGYGCDAGHHSALIYCGTEQASFREDEDGRVLAARPTTTHDDSRWPTACAKCGHEFGDDGYWQDWQELLYRRTDTGGLVTLRSSADDINAPTPAPPGSMWDAWWMPESWRGADGIALMVRLPNGHDWHVDSEASNCTRKGDRTHKCWVRHGDPRTASVHVDKAGDTCAAGAGSIQAEDYHGFMHHGVLTAG
jgi:hypothetical protein